MRRLLLLLSVVFMTTALWAQSQVLVGLDEEWRFTNAPVSLPAPGLAGWNQSGFPDGDWRVGRSGFGDTFYGEQTLVAGLSGDWRTMLFRHQFVVTQADRFRTLVLRVDYRDGFVAHLNGREIARRGFLEPPGQPVPFDTVPLPRLAGAAEELLLDPPQGLLLEGTNLLTFQVHSDSDLDRPVLVPELLADFTRGPYIQNVSSNHATILWWTPVAGPGRLWISPSNSFAGEPIEGLAVTNHEVLVSGLLPAQTYYYAVEAGAGDATVRSDTFTFRTLPASGPLRVAVFGDSGAGSGGEFAIGRRIASEKADLVLHLGDVIYPMFTRELTDTRFLSVYRDQMSSTPFAFVWGNHDLIAGWDPFRAVIRSPTNDTTAAEHKVANTIPENYYSFDAGDVHFVMGYQPYVSQYKLTTNSAQYRWMDADLAATTKPWKIFVTHHPRTCSGNHRFTDVDHNGIIDWQEVGPVMTDLARRHGVQLMLAGHDHNFERFLPQDGVHSLLTGGGGGSLYYLHGYVADSVQFYAGYNYTRLSFEGDTLRVGAVDMDGREFDRFVIQRVPPPVARQAANWAGPVIATAPANNGDGNITGQVFDFAGAPEILSFTGRFSNLGRAHVSLDKSYLYLGLESVMLPDDADVYAFLEVPGVPGVSSLAGLGNGILDPSGQGVDALDFLGNLSFGNFHPSVACVLGDEYADGTLRSFRRPGLTNALGQGVFRLMAGFPSVEGIRLQQFNRSPQDNAPAPEQNADLIELAIPRTVLGDLAAGSVIRLGIVTARGLDTVGRTRFVDTGYIGNGLTGGGYQGSSLEGLEVQLPDDPYPNDQNLTLQARADGMLVLDWSTVPGRRYDLQSTDRLTGVWLSEPGYPRDAVSIHGQQVVPNLEVTRFYRTRLAP